jgi:uncharacterized repeat protein (TIGR01451 family)
VLAAAVDLASISGTLYDDLNGNDQVDAGEPRIAGATVQLEDTSGANLGTTTSDASGFYEFRDLQANSYIVRQPAQTLTGGRPLLAKVSPTITITADDVTGDLKTPIDTFATTTQQATDDSDDGTPVTSQELTSDAIGGQRDLVVNKTSEFGEVELSVNRLISDVITFNSQSGGDGERRIIWDGIDADPVTVDDSGGGLNVDLTQDDATGFNLLMGTDVAGSTAIIRVYSNDGSPGSASRYSSASIPVPITSPLPSGRLDVIPAYVSFAEDFTAVGGGADFSAVTAIELEIEGTSTTNGLAELIGAFGPTPFTADFNNLDEAELAITKTVDNVSPNVGDTVNYTITISNNGPATATNVQVTDQLPSGVQFLSSSAGGNYNSATGVWNVGTLPADSNNQQTLTLTGRVQTLGLKNNVATITARDQTDQVTANDTAQADLTPQQIDLEVIKSIDQPQPNVGDPVTFSISVQNRQSQDATGVQVRDQLPAGLRIESPSDVTTTSGTYNPASGIWDVGTVAGNDAESLTIRAIVDSRGARTNTAEVIAANEADIDSTPGDGSGDDFATIDFATAAADLELTKTVDNATPNLGENVNFTITVNNAGPDQATGVTIADPLPSGLTFLQASDPTGYNPSSGIWTIGSIAAGDSRTLMLQASVDSTGAKTNSAEVATATVDDVDSTPGNGVVGEDDQAEVVITPVAADLSLTKSANNLAPDVGDVVRFQITVANSGPSTATNVAVRDQLPTGTQFVAAEYAPGSNRTGTPDFNPTTGVWNVGDVAVGSPVTLNLDVLVTGTGFQTNTAQIIAADQTDPDSTPNNDAPGEDDQDDAQIRPRQIDLMLTKVVDDFSPAVGDEIEFVITVNNTGEDVATNVQVAEQLPAGVTPLQETPSRGSYNRSTGVWNIGSVGVDNPVTLTIRTRVDSIGMGTNRAEIIAADQQDIDSTPGNGVATEDDQASVGFTTETADLSLTKTVFDNARPNAGEMIAFDLTVTNAGPDNATGVQITDLLPSGLTYVSNSVSAGIYNPASGVWTVGEIPAPTERQTLVIGAEVNQASSGTLNFTQQGSPASYQSPIAAFQADPLEETANALVGLGYLPSQFQLRQVARGDNPDGVNVEIRFLGAALEGVDVPQVDVTGNLNLAVNTDTIEDSAVNVNNFATLRLNAVVDTTNDLLNVAEITAVDQTDPDSTPGGGGEAEDDRATASVMPQSIDLSLTKTASNERPNPGDEVTFTLTVRNDGEDPASGVEVTDSLPAGLTFVRSQPSGVYDAPSGLWTVGDVAVGEARELQIVAVASSNVAETNSAEITAADQRDIDSTPGNGVDGEDDLAGSTVTPATADLEVNKTVDDPTPNLGSNVTFTIEVTNQGPDEATGVQLRDQIPAGMTLVSSQVSGGSYEASSGVWTLPAISANTTATLTLTASVDSIDDKTNVAQIIASDQLDPDSTPAAGGGDEDDQDQAILSPELIDLALTKTASNESPNIGEVVLFELGLTNEGPSDANAVAVRDVLPDGLSFRTSRPSTGAYNLNTGIWNVGSVPVGATPTLEIEAIVEAVAEATNTAEIVSADQPDADSTPDNGEAGEDDIASVTLTTQVADLSIEKTASNETPGRDEEVEFRITVSNQGPNTATDVVVRDPLPPGLRLISVDTTEGQYDPATGLWTIPSIVVGTPQQLRLVTAVTSAQPATNAAEIMQSRQLDPDSTPGNGASDEDDLDAATASPRVIDISIGGSISNDEPLEGETVQIAVVATNDGPADATGLEVSVPLPEGITLITSQPQSGTYNSNTQRWELGDLPAGEATRLALNVRIDQRGIKHLPIELIEAGEFDVDSTPGNSIEIEDDQDAILIKAPRLLQKRLFLSR